jgi:hypothetical protein
LLETELELLTNRLPTRHLPVRLLGFCVGQLDGTGRMQQRLFDQPKRERRHELETVAIRSRRSLAAGPGCATGVQRRSTRFCTKVTSRRQLAKVCRERAAIRL